MRKQSYFVIQELVSRELKRKYSRSRLGILWSVLSPLLSMAVLSLSFLPCSENPLKIIRFIT